MSTVLRGWATEHHELDVPECWRDEQIADLIIDQKLSWPEQMTCQDGWWLWTAHVRRTYGVRSIAWTETGVSPRSMEVAFTFTDGRRYEMPLPSAMLDQQTFREILGHVESRLKLWRVRDDARVQRRFKKTDEDFAEVAPDLMQPLLGFRAWVVHGGRIKPTGMGGDVWRGGAEVRAECVRGSDHRAPSAACECGLYGWHSFKALMHDHQATRPVTSPFVLGAVVARGRMEIHQRGFRAEYMRPVLFTNLPGEQERARQEGRIDVWRLAKLLGGIRVVGPDEIETVAQEYGQLVPDSLKPS